MLFLPPTNLTGDAVLDARTLYTYLYQLSEQLNAALDGVDARIGYQAQAVQEAAVGGSGGAWGGTGVDPSTSQTYQELRALIVKTGQTVRAEMDAIEQDLSSEYLAISDFGTFQENLDTKISKTAEGVLLDFDYSSRLDALDAEAAGFSSYQTTTEQYIKIGVVRYNDDGTIEAGVVVGKNLATVTIDGKEVVRSTDMYSCFTADRLSFWKDGVEVAYFSNRALHVTDIAVNEKVTLGGKWQISHANGFSIKWIGG